MIHVSKYIYVMDIIRKNSTVVFIGYLIYKRALLYELIDEYDIRRMWKIKETVMS